MTDLVDPSEIESLVGANRDNFWHYGRAVSEEQTFYILHSQACLDSGIDLRDCIYSRALDDKGILPVLWEDFQDTPQRLAFIGTGDGHENQTLICVDLIKSLTKEPYRNLIKEVTE